ADGDGTWDLDEGPLGGIAVDLLDKDKNVLASTATSGDGSYSFDDLVPCKYSVQVKDSRHVTGGSANVEGAGDSGLTTTDVDFGLFTNETPVGADDTYSVAHDNTLTVSGTGVLGNDTDADNDTLSVSVVEDVQSGTLTLNSDGSFTYVPDSGFS